MICYKKAKKLLLIVTLNGSISNNIGATTVQCVHSSRGWTGRNLILDEGLMITKCTWPHIHKPPPPSQLSAPHPSRCHLHLGQAHTPVEKEKR